MLPTPSALSCYSLTPSTPLAPLPLMTCLSRLTPSMTATPTFAISPLSPTATPATSTTSLTTHFPIVPDDRIIILGSRNFFTYEFIPRNKNDKAFYFLIFLKVTCNPNRNEENNLYPFLHLFPNTNLFNLQLASYPEEVVDLFIIFRGTPRTSKSEGHDIENIDIDENYKIAAQNIYHVVAQN
ncbi:hypothetical protein Fmac_018030 [Flemingia macrophylla]|uniref:Glyoxal oxidase N-terminal domain-containing protein n=1 Tax=Flemingia macrophylla TaxID=520843 RepID=A0ABD1M3U5_9FABA